MFVKFKFDKFLKLEVNEIHRISTLSKSFLPLITWTLTGLNQIKLEMFLKLFMEFYADMEKGYVNFFLHISK